ncbi:MAG: hypothetical protein ACR2GY_07275 [Phycisphaerales bacterium]
MAQAYTPGLKVTARTTHRCRRVLPIAGDVLVQVGETVRAETIVARTALPGDITPINMANVLAAPAADVRECMLKREGEHVEVGEIIARTKGMFGMFKKEHVSKHSGTIENISDTTGQVMLRGAPIPVEVAAYMPGRVLEVLPDEGCVIENDVTYIQGIFGIGGETSGPIVMAAQSERDRLEANHLTEEMKGCVVVGGARMTAAAIERAVAVGAAAVVSGGIDDQDLRAFLGYDLGVAITGSENKGITLIVTEGFGDIAMAVRTFELLQSRAGREASVNGATQIRAGVMRPEVIIPALEHEKAVVAEFDAGQLEIDRPVRVIRDPWFGQIGRVASLPTEPAVLGSGSKARVLAVALDSGENVVVPRANVELIEG